MAAHQGEDVAATLFADVHYYYGPPTAKPPHHRFDKGSYVYLYENASQRRARLEIANNAGTPDQDAFDGFLDKTHIEYSYKHSSLVTVTVGAGADGAPASADHEWRLPTFDPRNEKKYLYKLHTIDLYFWEKEDAELFVNAIRRVLPGYQLSILDEPEAEVGQHHEMSPVVQQLENIAISDPSYQHGQTRDSRPSAATSAPPLSAVPQPHEPQKTFAPLAYNPAAPAAPEAIRHREKTPPPEDGAANPLVAAAVSDQGQNVAQHSGFQQFAPPPGSAFGPSQAPYFPGPPQASQTSSPYSSPPPAPLIRTQSIPQSTQPQQVANSTQQPAQHAQYPSFPGPPSFSPPPQSAAQQAPPQSPGFAPPPSAPAGGFSSYQYSQTQAAPTGNEYNIHQQVYRPTEGEVATKYKPAKEPRGKLEDSAVKLEKGVTGFLKKLEKKYG